MQAACWEESKGQGESEGQGYWGALTRPSDPLSLWERVGVRVPNAGSVLRGVGGAG